MSIPGLSIDTFDKNAAIKQFEDIKSKANANLSMDPAKIASKLGTSPEALGLTGDKFSSAKDMLGNIGDPSIHKKVNDAMQDMRAEQITGVAGQKFSDLPPNLQAQVGVELGSMTQNKFVNGAKSEWSQQALADGKKIMNVETSNGEERPQLQYGNATNKPESKERDEQYTTMMTPNQSGSYIKEGTKEDEDSYYIIHKGKQTALRMNDEGLHISTDQSCNQRICVNRNIVIDGASSIVVNGGNYDIYINGQVNIYATNDINMTTDTNINMTAKGNINIECNGNMCMQTHGNWGAKSDGESVINATGDLSLCTQAGLMLKASGECAMGGGGDMSLKGGGTVSIDGGETYINSGKSKTPTPTQMNPAPVTAANPAKQPVCKV